MALSYAPFEDVRAPKPPVYSNPIKISESLPTSDNTECNYIVMFFVAGVIIMGIMDSLRK
jgi:hypothetical protein